MAGNTTGPALIPYRGGACARRMAAQSIEVQIARCASWPERFEPQEWSLYKSVMQEARRRGVPFAVGGGLAAMTYAGQWRNTKDLDLYICERDRDGAIRILIDQGLNDYYEKQPYDRKWIYRGYKGDTIIDLIWAMANQRARVDPSWLEGPEVEAGGERFHLLRPEEALWSKLYVQQRDRSDWPDALNLLYGVGPDMDFHRLLGNLGADVLLLTGLLTVFAWLCPDRARQLPEWLWSELRLERPSANGNPEQVRDRARLLDSRPWFTPALEEN